MSEINVSIPKQYIKDMSQAKVSTVHNYKVYAWWQIGEWPNLGLPTRLIQLLQAAPGLHGWPSGYEPSKTRVNSRVGTFFQYAFPFLFSVLILKYFTLV